MKNIGLRAFSREGITNYHDPMTNSNGLIKLNDLRINFLVIVN